jgi:putative hydrolase of the HAD superfamily
MASRMTRDDSRMSDRVVMWDFDGTLARRPGLWSGCLLEVLDENEPEHCGTPDGVRAALRPGFPWNRHEVAHPELADADAWWAALTPTIAGAIAGCGIEPERAHELAGEVRLRFIDPSRGWELFADARDALIQTQAGGWRNVIVSNHVPELAQLVEHLGLAALVERVFSSAVVGFEKPHAEIYRHVLSVCGNPRERWMIGDNPVADVAGAQAAGIPAILIRSSELGPRSVPDALAAARLVLGAGASR